MRKTATRQDGTRGTDRRRMWTAAIASAATVQAVLVTVAGGTGSVAAGASTSPSASTGAATVPPLTLSSRSVLSSRLSQLTLEASTLTPTQTQVRVLLPAGYNSSSKHYPVVYLFPGGLENQTVWTEEGNAAAATAKYQMIFVMPDPGPFGYYTNWYNKGAFGVPEWETYFVDQLIPYVDGHYRTIDNRDERAMAGDSLGGFGAFSLAARHPDLVGAAASFSGAIDITTPVNQSTLVPIAPSIWGTYDAQQVRWRGVNPADLAANLSNTNLSMYVGNGTPGPAGLANLEKMVKQEAVIVNSRLDRLGIKHIYDNYGAGIHAWPYFKRDLTWWLPRLEKYFKAHTPAPKTFTYASTNPQYSVYRWDVSVDRPAMEFSSLQVTGPETFSMVGSGTAEVTTAPVFAKDTRYHVVVHGSSSDRTESVTSSSTGQLKISVDLGPGNQNQQFTEDPNGSIAYTASSATPFPTQGISSTFYRSKVTISR